MNGKTSNGTASEQGNTVGSALPARMDNPFLQPAWPKPFGGRPLAIPSARDPRLTKTQQRVCDKGGVQLLQQHFQHLKADYAISASAQVDDLANSAFVHVGSNIVARMRANPYPELQPYLGTMMQAQLLRMGQELNQLAGDHAHTQDEILSEIIDVAEDDLRSFWTKLVASVKHNG